MSHKTVEQRFWEKVERNGPDECWNWKASTTKNGYGNFVVGNRKNVNAHRFAYELANGKIHDGRVIRHSCDNKKCVNPSHLIDGTQKDNMDDKMRRGRGRWVSGERHGGAKLSEKDVLDIRITYAKGGATQKNLAEKYRVCPATISQAIRRVIWRDI